MAEPAPCTFVAVYRAQALPTDKLSLIYSYRFRKVKALVKSGKALWLVPGVSAQLRHKTAEQIAASMSETCYDTCLHPGEWRKVNPFVKAAAHFRAKPAQIELARPQREFEA